MSAERYSPCPACVARAQKNHEAAIIKRDTAYGKITAAEYADLAALIKPPNPAMYTTYAEYFELYLRAGKVMISYSAQCSRCDYKHSFVREEPQPPVSLTEPAEPSA